MSSSRAHKMAKGQYSSGGAVGRAMRTMRRHYADGGDVVKERAMFLPLGTYGDGTTRAAWPGLLYEPAAAWKRMMDSGYRHGDAENTRKMAEDSFTVSGAVPLAGLAAGAVRGRMPHATLSSNAADDAAKRLPMDDASRMARAKEMGFDTERTAYRGLTRPYDDTDTGYYQMFTSDPAEASEYAMQNSLARPNVMPVMLRRGRNLSVDAGGALFNNVPTHDLPDSIKKAGLGATARIDEIAHAARQNDYDSLTVNNVYDNVHLQVGKPKPAVNEAEMAELDDLLAALGFKDDPNYVMPQAGYRDLEAHERKPVSIDAVFNPSRIRSRFAAFDPDKINSSDLLASNPSTASVLSLIQDRKDRR